MASQVGTRGGVRYGVEIDKASWNRMIQVFRPGREDIPTMASRAVTVKLAEQAKELAKELIDTLPNIQGTYRSPKYPTKPRTGALRESVKTRIVVGPGYGYGPDVAEVYVDSDVTEGEHGFPVEHVMEGGITNGEWYWFGQPAPEGARFPHIRFWSMTTAAMDAALLKEGEAAIDSMAYKYRSKMGP